MRSNIAKWGNSLAVRLPAASLRAAGLQEGSSVDVEVTADGDIRVVRANSFDMEAFLRRLAKLHRRMPESAPVIGPMRDGERY